MSSIIQPNSPTPSSLFGTGGGAPLNVNISSIDGTVPSLTIDNLNVQLSHADATPDSVRIGDGTTLVGNDFGASTASFRVAALLGNSGGAADFGSGAAGAQTLRAVLEDQSRSNLDDIDTAVTSMDTTLTTLDGKVANDYGLSSGAVRTAAQIGNATGEADFNSGTAGAQTLRTVLATRHEDSATPVSVRPSDGTNFLEVEGLAASQKTLASLTNNALATIGVILGWDGSTHREISVDANGKIQVESAPDQLTIGTDGSVTVGGSDTLVLASNSNRRYVVLVNDSPSVMYLRLGGGAATLNSGIRINPNGGSYEINSDNLYTGEIRGIGTGAGGVLTVVEAT